jgi:hypothetical protein
MHVGAVGWLAKCSNETGTSATHCRETTLSGSAGWDSSSPVNEPVLIGANEQVPPPIQASAGRRAPTAPRNL